VLLLITEDFKTQRRNNSLVADIRISVLDLRVVVKGDRISLPCF